MRSGFIPWRRDSGLGLGVADPALVHPAVRNYWGPDPIRLEMGSHEMGRTATPSYPGTAPASIATRVRLETRGAAARARLQM